MFKYTGNQNGIDVEEILASFDLKACPEANLQLPDPSLVVYYKNYSNRVIYLDRDIDDTLFGEIRNIITWNREDASENGHVTIVAYDTDTMSVKWQVNTYNNPGYGLNNMYILDEKLFILSGTAVGCFNINDGNVIYEVRPTMEQIKNELIVSTPQWLAGMDYYDGKLYVTNLNNSGTASSMGCKPEVIKNIICFDTKDGSYVWGYLPPHASSLCSRPVIVNGKCFVNCFFSLRVFDAKTGELLGRDDSIYGNGFAHSVSYNNKFITYNLINEETWCLVAISGD